MNTHVIYVMLCVCVSVCKYVPTIDPEPNRYNPIYYYYFYCARTIFLFLCATKIVYTQDIRERKGGDKRTTNNIRNESNLDVGGNGD